MGEEKIEGIVDITLKPEVYRESTAYGIIRLKPSTIRRIREGKIPKGDVLTTARIAAILAVKNTPQIIPHCHPIPITGIEVNFEFIDPDKIKCVVKVKTTWKTGVEMDALTGVMASLLTIWDMVKKFEKDENGNYPDTWIVEVKVAEKTKRPLE